MLLVAPVQLYEDMPHAAPGVPPEASGEQGAGAANILPAAAAAGRHRALCSTQLAAAR